MFAQIFQPPHHFTFLTIAEKRSIMKVYIYKRFIIIELMKRSLGLMEIKLSSS